MFGRLQNILILVTASLREAMKAIHDGQVGICLVVDSEKRLIGTLTDGDIRRALLKEVSLDEAVKPFIQRNFTCVTEYESRTEVLDLMKAHFLQQIPVVDSDGRVVGLHLLREIIGAAVRPNWAVIMAGGRGERLRPITDSIPKPMIKIAGRPILERLILHLVGYGIRRIFIAVNYMADFIEDYFCNGEASGCRIDYLRETKPLGTGGALSLLSELPSDPILVLNGDLVTQFNVARILGLHSEQGFDITVGVHEYVHQVPFGVIETNGLRVTCLREKPTIIWLANAGIYVIEPNLLERVPEQTFYPLPSLIEDCIARKESIGYFRIEDDWKDVGSHDELRIAKGEVTSDKAFLREYSRSSETIHT